MMLNFQCCACGKKLDEETFCQNIQVLPFKAPIAGTGWGCMQCGLALDGALAVLCEQCRKDHAQITHVIHGEIDQGHAIALAEFTQVPFKHDRTKHPEMQQLTDERVRVIG